MGSVGDVSRVLLACVLHALGTNPAAVRGFRNRFPKPNFEMMSARFQTSVPGYSRIVSCDVGRPGGYLFSFLFFLFSGFRRRRFDSFIGLCFACLGYESCCCPRLSQPFSKAKFRDDVGAIPDERTCMAIVELFLAMSEGLEAILFLSFSFFLVGSVGDVSRVLLACVLHALGTNPAAVRGFRNRFPKPNFEMMSARFQTSVPGYSRIVSCDVGRPGGYLFSFLFFLFSGFRRRRFDSFIGLCFACLGYESCCCSRLSQPFSKAKFRDDVGAIPDERAFLFFLFSGFRRRRFESFIGLCFACLGYESCCCSRLSQPFSKAKFRDDVGAIPDERTFLFFLFSGFRRRRFESFIGLCFACLGYESCCCSRLSQPFSKAKFRDDVGAIPDERTWLYPIDRIRQKSSLDLFLENRSIFQKSIYLSFV